MTFLERRFLNLVRIGIGNIDPIQPYIPNETNWDKIMALAMRQGLSAVILDAIERLPENQRPPKELLLLWIGRTLQGYEQRYRLYQRAISEMAAFYNKHHFKMMVLKGYACSRNWPKPEHRPCGDIDIWLFGNQRIADEVLSQETGIKVDTSKHHHTVFYWQGFMVENHYDFLNVHHHKSSAKLERTLKLLGTDDTHYIELFGEKVYIPSPNLHALFLLRHAMTHFAATELNLRQLFDWAFFVKAQGKNVDWPWLMTLLQEYGMKDLFDIINTICIEDLGFDSLLFPKSNSVDSTLKERVLQEILSPEFSITQPSGNIVRVIWKFRRWKANIWKHKLCYKESLWSAFWSGVWNHLLKPSSI